MFWPRGAMNLKNPIIPKSPSELLLVVALLLLSLVSNRRVKLVVVVGDAWMQWTRRRMSDRDTET